MPVRFIAKHAARLPDATAEAIRQVHDRQIEELQGQARELAGTTGRYLGRQILTSTGTYNPTPGATVARLRDVGGGGGGGGATPGAGVGAAAGGTSGVMLDIVVGTPGRPLTGGAFSCGAGGAGGSTAGGNGGTGGDTTIRINGVDYTAKGGGGGAGMVGVAGNNAVLPTAPAAGTSAGGTTTYGLGEPGVVIGGAVWFSGDGGGSPMGAGAVAVAGTTAGNPGDAHGFGGGGSGAAAQTTGKAGGAGGAGGIIVEEYS